MQLLLVSATGIALLALLGGLEEARRRNVPPAVTRRTGHVIGASGAAGFPLYLELHSVLVLAALFAALLGLTQRGQRLGSVHAVNRPSLGAPLLPAGLGVAALVSWSHPAAFTFGALVLGLADVAAGIAGARQPILVGHAFGGSKSLGGSLAFMFVCLPLAAIFAASFGHSSLAGPLLVAIALSAVEGALSYGLDNLALPLLGAILGRAVLGL